MRYTVLLLPSYKLYKSPVNKLTGIKRKPMNDSYLSTETRHKSSHTKNDILITGHFIICINFKAALSLFI